MNAPFGILFLKKAELYNLVKRLNKQVKQRKKQHPKSKNPDTWPVEKQILKWSYHGHKYLASPITDEHFKSDSSHNKLGDWELLDKNGKVLPKYRPILNCKDKIRENMVERGFARYYGNLINTKDIVISKEGLLLGDVIYNVTRKNPFIRFAYWFYSLIIDYIGALILLLLVIIPTLIILIYNLIILLCE